MIDNSTISTVAVAVLTAIPATVLAYATLRNSRTNTAKADEIIGKATEIKTETNGQLTKVMAALAVANEKILGLEKLNVQRNNPLKTPTKRSK